MQNQMKPKNQKQVSKELDKNRQILQSLALFPDKDIQLNQTFSLKDNNLVPAATSQQKPIPQVNPSQNWFKFKNSQQLKSVTQQDTNQYRPSVGSTLNPDPSSHKGVTPIVALDCEMVNCLYKGRTVNKLARVSIVNYNGHVLIDKYVSPGCKVVNYLTRVSGIRPCNIINAPKLQEIKDSVSEILNNRIIVGHSLINDFNALEMAFSTSNIRDLAKFQCLRGEENKLLSLKKMSQKYLNISGFQEGEHDSVQDARVTMEVFQKNKDKIEEELKKGTKNYSQIKQKLMQDISKKKKIKLN